jgi:two-component system nitrate/nitrite response regulator NarL
MVDLVLADAHEIFVDALRAVLPEQGFAVVGSANTLAATFTTIRRHQPDVCLLDRHFADGDGIEAIGKLLEACDRMKVIMLTADGGGRGMQDALDSGATGYVDKCCGLTALINAIHAVMVGEVIAEVAAAEAPRPSGNAEAHRLAAHLTTRERECLRLLVDGDGTTAMAKRLGVSSTTIRTHVQAILTKLGVHSRLEAASFALRHGLLAAGADTGLPQETSRRAGA